MVFHRADNLQVRFIRVINFALSSLGYY